MNKLRKNKKGEDMLVDFWAILIFVFILIIFLIVFLVDKRGDAPETENFGDADAAFMLNSFIRAPYTDDKTKTIGELIAEQNLYKKINGKEYAGPDAEAFKSFFSGVEKYKNQAVCEYWLTIDGSGIVAYTYTKNPTDNVAKPSDCQSIETTTTIPRLDGTEIKIKLQIYYDQDENKAFK